MRAFTNAEWQATAYLVAVLRDGEVVRDNPGFSYICGLASSSTTFSEGDGSGEGKLRAHVPSEWPKQQDKR
jgi:archaellum component FlaF (FlaF/FlaG flagellin family)